MFTEHKPLVTLLGPTKRVLTLTANGLATCKWALTISQYKYQIEHRKTADHANVDAICHLPAGSMRNLTGRSEEWTCLQYVPYG